MLFDYYNWKEINIYDIIQDIQNGKIIKRNFLVISFFSSVVSLSICPTEETFLTSSIDNTLRLWDVRIPTSQVKKQILLKFNLFYSNRAFSMHKQQQDQIVVQSLILILKVI